MLGVEFVKPLFVAQDRAGVKGVARQRVVRGRFGDHGAVDHKASFAAFDESCLQAGHGLGNGQNNGLCAGGFDPGLRCACLCGAQLDAFDIGR